MLASACRGKKHQAERTAISRFSTFLLKLLTPYNEDGAVFFLVLIQQKEHSLYLESEGLGLQNSLLTKVLHVLQEATHALSTSVSLIHKI